MPTNQDEILQQCYARDHQDHLKLCGSMTAEQVADLQLQLNNALAGEDELRKRLTIVEQRNAELLVEIAKRDALLDELGCPLDEVSDLFENTAINAKRYEWLRNHMSIDNFPKPHPDWSEPAESESIRIDELCDAALKPTESGASE